MFSVTECETISRNLGQRLRALRLAKDQSMRVFAERIGVSVPTLRAMENGAAAARFGHWINAFWALGRLGEIDDLLAQRTGLLAQALSAPPRPRQRARRRSAGPR